MLLAILLDRRSYRDDPNRGVSDKLVKEVRLNNPNFSAADIRGKEQLTTFWIIRSHVEMNNLFIFTAAVYTYYTSLCQDDSEAQRNVCEKKSTETAQGKSCEGKDLSLCHGQ